jgi:ATP-dependent Clp protease adaptor protein ClpS
MEKKTVGIQFDLITETLTETVLKKPRKYRVFLQNDDYTPMDFVVLVLEQFFNKNREEAVQIMLQVHNSGKGICGIYTYDIAETKVSQVNHFSMQHEYPLLCEAEPID